tara:strand:+ start:1061 stop:1444 length:384 start_codon:yes stop_codon:yes gene_type:complete
MKITIEITIETHENNPPSLEVRTVESPDSEEMIQTTLEAFNHPSIGEELEKAYKPNSIDEAWDQAFPLASKNLKRNVLKSIAPREHLTYEQGRNVHRCTNCFAPHRRVDKDTGYCKEATCPSGVWQG